MGSLLSPLTVIQKLGDPFMYVLFPSPLHLLLSSLLSPLSSLLSPLSSLLSPLSSLSPLFSPFYSSFFPLYFLLIYIPFFLFLFSLLPPSSLSSSFRLLPSSTWLGLTSLRLLYLSLNSGSTRVRYYFLIPEFPENGSNILLTWTSRLSESLPNFLKIYMKKFASCFLLSLTRVRTKKGKVGVAPEC
jgi:hypothetical protein